jgi:hypothetical protein
MAATNCHARAHGRLVRRRTRAPANKPYAPPCLLSCGVFLSSTSIGRRRSILCGCGGSAAWANGSEVGERRGRQAGAGEDGGGRDAGDLGFGDGSRSEGWVAALDPGGLGEELRISERGMCSGRVLGLVSCVLGCSLQTKTHKSSFAA